MLGPKGRSFRAAAVVTASTAAFLSLVAGGAPALTAAPAAWHVDFQPAGVKTAAGYVADVGAGFSATRGFGWISQTSTTAKTLTDHAFDRNVVADQRVDSVMHTQVRWSTVKGETTGTADPARWELAVPNGNYDVTVGAGDPKYADGDNVVMIEGVKAVDHYKPTATAKTTTATVRVPVSDGRLTLDSAGGTNTRVGYIDVTAAASPTSAHVNFQPAGSAIPAGYTADSGAAFDAVRGSGWISQTSSTPKSLTGHAFDRNATTDQLRDTHINMQLRWTQVNGTWTGALDPARWEMQLANGSYDVTVGAGDSANADGIHTVAVEGTKAVNAFQPSTAARHTTATVRVTLSDGRLTLDANGGTNTKVNFVDVIPATGPDPTVPDDTVPEDTVPGDTVPDDTVPDDTVPDDTVPPPAGSAKGDVATAEPRLVADPKMLWVGTADEGSWTSTWGQTGAGQLGNTAQTTAPAGGYGKSIRIANAGGGTSGDRWGYDGRFGFKEAGVASQDEAYLRYYVWFPADYEFDTQGKMPGLQGVVPGGSPWLANNSITCTSGPYEGKDCHDDRQFGARTMWKNGGMISYLNVVAVGGQDRDALRTSSGDNYSFSIRYRTVSGADMKLKTGWNYVEQHVKLNTPGVDNGVFEGWINGERGIRLTDVQYRTAARADLRINQWNLAHFWGGPTSDYPERATQVHYDDIAISTGPIGGRVT